jgi:predicted nucleic acid-binding protein
LILPDVNVLIYAYRSDADRHVDYKAWLETTLNGPAAFGISPQVLGGFLRICTHPRIFLRPSSLDQTFEFWARVS